MNEWAARRLERVHGGLFMPYRTQALPIPDELSPELKRASGPDIKAVNAAPKPVAPPAAAGDPLAVIKAMSVEETIALFS